MNPWYETVADRAHHRCEYCQAPEQVFNFPFEVEHIIPISKQGSNEMSNLALACRSCNLRKGDRIKGHDLASDSEVRFFHPRRDLWHDHFQVDVMSGKIVGLTTMGSVTAQHLKMNSPAQTQARKLWVQLDLFP